MPSPFPGMDPYIENQEWEDFHGRFNNALAEALSPQVRPRYVVRIERRVYVDRPSGDASGYRRADVAIVPAGDEPAFFGGQGAAATIVAPVEVELPQVEERREMYLVIRDRESKDVVTIIETLSPANKRPSSDGRREYLEKRQSILDSHTNLVELDLLRGGEGPPVVGERPAGDFFAIVSRARRRPRAMVYPFRMEDKLGTIPVPLLPDDGDAMLDLQQAVDVVYERAGYDLSLDYQAALHVPLDAAAAAWVRQRVEAWHSSVGD